MASIEEYARQDFLSRQYFPIGSVLIAGRRAKPSSPRASEQRKILVLPVVGTLSAKRRTKPNTPMLVLAKKHGNETSEARKFITLSNGFIGLPEVKQLEIVNLSESWPLTTLRSPDPQGLHFLAIEPHDFIPGYVLELNDIDTEALGIARVEDALVFNIVTVHSAEPQFVTTNLIGPVVVNRVTGLARQVIITNSDQYSARHVLVDERGKA